MSRPTYSSRGCVAHCLVAVLLTALLWPVQAQPSSSMFDTANQLYEQGKFAEAAAAYEAIAKTNGSAAALYNLGNARFKAGEVGRAIFAYRQALRASPRDPDLRANLRFAREQVQGPTLQPARLARALANLTVNEWTFVAAAALWALLVLLAAIQWKPALSQPLRYYAIAVGAAALVLGACAGAAYLETRRANLAIVVVDQVTVRHGPLDESASAFLAHDGAELRILDRKGDWLQVSPDPRRIGWLRRDQVLVL